MFHLCETGGHLQGFVPMSILSPTNEEEGEGKKKASKDHSSRIAPFSRLL